MIKALQVCVMKILFGQEDYVARVKAYLSVRHSVSQLLLCSLPLQTEKPDATSFDWEMARARLQGMPHDAEVFVAFSQKYHRDAKQLLEDEGFSHLVFYDAALDHRLKEEYFRHVFADEGREFLLLSEMEEEHLPVKRLVEVYLAKCVVDKPLAGYPQELPAEVIPIQVGAALTPERIAAVTDDTGDNISTRNRRYSEMTAFYWMWKNAHADYLGLCHYRRLWVNLPGIVQKLCTTDVDAVLPLPTLCEHSVYEDYLLKHIPEVWRPMLKVLREQSPDYAKAAQKLFKGRIFYASNMCILRREVLDDLCAWMFPIVMEVERIVGDLPDRYYNRYAGFCTERLITLYFLYNEKHWRIAHAEKIFIG